MLIDRGVNPLTHWPIEIVWDSDVGNPDAVATAQRRARKQALAKLWKNSAPVYDECIVCGWRYRLAAPYPAELCVRMICEICFVQDLWGSECALSDLPDDRPVTLRITRRDLKEEDGCH